MQQPESEQRMSGKNGEFTAYAVGAVYASVCTSLNNAESTDRLNAEHPAGWQIATEPFASGDPNGRPCNERPSTHRHLLFSS